jgi:DNA-binding transcriptional MerR regulator
MEDCSGDRASLPEAEGVELPVTSVALPRGARAACAAIAATFLPGGLAAVFLTENSAAAVALVLVGSGALFLSLAGRVPLRLKIAGAEVDVSYDRAFEAGRDTGADAALSVATAEISSTSADPDLILDLIQRVNTRLEALTSTGPNSEQEQLLYDPLPVDASSDLPVLDAQLGYRGPTACKAAGITYRQLDYWARTGLVTPSLRSGGNRPRLYAFRDILLLKVVRRLLESGVSLQQVRGATSHLRERDVAYLAEITVMSDGENVYECTSAEEVVDLVQAGVGIFGIAIGRVWREVEESLAELPGELVGPT